MNISKHNLIQIQDLQKEIEENDDLEKIKLEEYETENIEILKIPKGNSYKWPKLSELSDFYKVPFDNNNLHDSYYDTLILARVVYKMFKHPEAREKLLYFLEKN